MEFAVSVLAVAVGWRFLMRKQVLIGFLLGGVLAVAGVTSANATPICSGSSCTFSLNTWAGSGSGPTVPPAPWGSIVLTQDGVNVDVAVSTNPSVFFASTGAGASLLWSISGDPTLTLTGLNTTDFSFSAGSPTIHEDGTGYWNYAINCTICGTGGSPPQIGGLNALTFTIDNVQLANFVTSVDNKGSPTTTPLASDLAICAAPGSCTTGDVEATLTVTTGGGSGPPPVPEPGILSLFGTGLCAVAAMMRRRKKKVV